MAKNTKYSEKDFENAKRLLYWSKFNLWGLGLWPKLNKFIFLLHYYAYSWHWLSDFVTLFFTFSSHNLMKVIGSGMECLSLTVVQVRFSMFKNYNKDFVAIFSDFSKDYSIKNYQSEKEKKIFLYYNSKSKKFISIVIVALISTGGIYIMQPLLQQLSKF